MIEAAAIGAFLFVTMVVGGFRALKTIDANRERAAAERRRNVARRAASPTYTGPTVNHWGRETEN